MTENWDNRFMELAVHVGGWSKDSSRKVGCVIVGPHNEIRATGYNGFPRGADDDKIERHARPQKYLWTEHAERNAIYNAARSGTPLEGCRIYVPWFPCMDCARAIVQVGIKHLIAVRPDEGDPQWGEAFTAALELLNEANVEIRWFDLQGQISQAPRAS
ncbi:dCMP deaminase family protein [Bradyrhizobium diazoefficiens]|uniref:deoxycytidylate deaminase n=1 Tax=Bradyrhizobium diazoefficiens TaxID=1355477 RepID=UPI001909804E|nr:dCMP deaminase family protein [Bradyrhizobium diazoefficiens]QQO33191.1 dCMP deaminase family protein [Bradyrhizobium diazoefficiens]